MAAPYPFRRLIALCGITAFLSAASCARGTSAIHLSSYVASPQFYSAFFENNRTLTASLSRIRGGIVSHHLLAGREIAGFFRAIRPFIASSGSIVIIGPNHRSQGTALIATSPRPWKTPFGLCRADMRIINRLVRRGAAERDDAAFRNEHAIGSLVPFIAYMLPDHAIVPILLSYRLKWEDAKRLGAALAEACGENDIIILSADFAHNRLPAEARRSDRRAAAVIMACPAGIGPDRASEIEMDCRKGLVALCEFLRLTGACEGEVLLNTNGGEIASVTGPVTSYFFAVYGTKTGI